MQTFAEDVPKEEEESEHSLPGGPPEDYDHDEFNREEEHEHEEHDEHELDDHEGVAGTLIGSAPEHKDDHDDDHEHDGHPNGPQ